MLLDLLPLLQDEEEDTGGRGAGILGRSRPHTTRPRPSKPLARVRRSTVRRYAVTSQHSLCGSVAATGAYAVSVDRAATAAASTASRHAVTTSGTAAAASRFTVRTVVGVRSRRAIDADEDDVLLALAARLLLQGRSR